MRGSSWKFLKTLALLVAVPLALACQPGDEGQPGMEEEMEQPGQEQQTQQQQEPMGQTETVSFTAINDSGVTGDVQFTREANTLTVEVMAQMEGPGDYPSHIHEGTCDQPGGVAVPLNTAEAAEPGIAEATTEVDAMQLEAGSDYLVMIHGQQGAPQGCAEVPQSVLEGGGA